MDKAALINIDIDRGAEVVDILDRAKLRPKVVMWAHLSEYEDWRLVIAAREFDALEIRAAYRRKVSQWHPDRLDRRSEDVRQRATAQMAAINEAYRLLCSGIA